VQIAGDRRHRMKLERFHAEWKRSSSYFTSNFIGLRSLRDFQSDRYCSMETTPIVLNFDALSAPDLACASHFEFKSMRAVSIKSFGVLPQRPDIPADHHEIGTIRLALDESIPSLKPPSPSDRRSPKSFSATSETFASSVLMRSFRRHRRLIFSASLSASLFAAAPLVSRRALRSPRSRRRSGGLRPWVDQALSPGGHHGRRSLWAALPAGMAGAVKAAVHFRSLRK
jgi:hypothetical protein